MKAIKNICTALLALPFVAFMACSEEEADYSAAKKLNTAQVYFSNTMGSVIEASKEASSVSVPIYRLNTDGQVQVDILSTCSSDAFVIPSSVTFADSANVADLVITYDPETLEYGEFADITLVIGDSTFTTPYGDASFEGSIGVPEPWTDWALYNSAGTCTYMDRTGWMERKDTDRGFYYRQNTISTNKYQFLIENCLDNINLILDYDSETGYVACQPQLEGYTHSSYGDIYVADYNNYMLATGNETDDSMWGVFDEENGTIRIYFVFYVPAGVFTHGWEEFQLDGYQRLDTSIGVTYTGKLITPDDNVFACANVALGEDVSRAIVALIPGELTQAAFNSVLDGTDNYDKQEITESGEVRFDMAGIEPGDYTILVISYIGQEAQQYDYKTFSYTTGGVAAWTQKWIGDYTYTLFFGSEDEPDVDEGLVCLQKNDDETVFKIAGWGYGVDFLFSFTDGGAVVVEDQETGYVHSSVGMIYIDDLTDYTGGTNYGQSSYDEETGTFNFAVIYYYYSDNYHAINYGTETFTLTDAATKARVDAAYHKALQKGGTKQASPDWLKKSPRQLMRLQTAPTLLPIAIK